MRGHVTSAPVVQAVWGQPETEQKVPKPKGHLTEKHLWPLNPRYVSGVLLIAFSEGYF